MFSFSVSVKWERRLKIILGASWMLFIGLAILFPTYWIVLTSLKKPREILERPPIYFIDYLSFHSYKNVWTNPVIDFPGWLLNSFVIAISATIISTFVATLAALAFTRLRFPGQRRLGVLVFVAYLIPASLLFIPMYLMLARVHLLESKLGLITVYISFTLPFIVWMLRGYFQTIPKDLEECAMIDGCSRIGAWVRVVLPLAAPGVAAASIFAFTNAWNEYLFAWTLGGAASRTAPVGLTRWVFLDMFFWGELSAGAVFLAIPAVLMYLLGQRFIVSGLTGGAVKG